MGVFRFIKSAITGAGVGVGDYAVAQNVNLTPASYYGPRHNVRQSLGPCAPAFAKVGQQIVPVSMLGDTGVALQGQMILAPLANPKG
jgi:hypothetical protein